MVCIWLRTMNTTTPYPADMIEFVNKMYVKDLRDFLGAVYFVLRNHEANTGTGWWGRPLKNMRKADLRKVIIDNKFPCNIEIIDKLREPNAKSRLDWYEWYQVEYLNEFYPPPPPPPPLTELELARRELQDSHECYTHLRASLDRTVEARRDLERRLSALQELIQEKREEAQAISLKVGMFWIDRGYLAKKVDELDPTLEACSICMEDKKTSERLNIKRKHSLCDSCFEQMREHASGNPLRCPICRVEMEWA